MSDIEAKIKVLKEKKEGLMQQWIAAVRQQSKVLSDADKIKIQLEIDDLDRQVTQLQDEISQLESSGNKEGQVYRSYSQSWEDKLPQLNFKKSKKIIRDVFANFEVQKEEQALFYCKEAIRCGEIYALNTSNPYCKKWETGIRRLNIRFRATNLPTLLSFSRRWHIDFRLRLGLIKHGFWISYASL